MSTFELENQVVLVRLKAFGTQANDVTARQLRSTNYFLNWVGRRRIIVRLRFECSFIAVLRHARNALLGIKSTRLHLTEANSNWQPCFRSYVINCRIWKQAGNTPDKQKQLQRCLFSNLRKLSVFQDMLSNKVNNWARWTYTQKCF